MPPVLDSKRIKGMKTSLPPWKSIATRKEKTQKRLQQHKLLLVVGFHSGSLKHKKGVDLSVDLEFRHICRVRHDNTE